MGSATDGVLGLTLNANSPFLSDKPALFFFRKEEKYSSNRQCLTLVWQVSERVSVELISNQFIDCEEGRGEK